MDAPTNELVVGHDPSELRADTEYVFTLDDSNVLDEQEDRLIDTLLVQDERSRANTERRTKKRLFVPWEDEAQNILPQYDDASLELPRRSFRLGAPAPPQEAAAEQPKGASLVSTPSARSEYVDEQQKRRPRRLRQRVVVPDEPSSVDAASLLDDSDLQRAISATRKGVQARNRDGASARPEPSTNLQSASDAFLVSDATQFISEIGQTSAAAAQPKTARGTEPLGAAPPECAAADAAPKHDEQINIIKEPLLGRGIGVAALLLKSRGEFAPRDSVQARDPIHARDSIRTRDSVQARDPIHARDSIRTRDTVQARGPATQPRASKPPQAPGNRGSPPAAQKTEYRPIVNLSYKDEFGREISSKEAFKRLCYRFHGQRPGKKKTEKRLRKILEERRIQSSMGSVLSSLRSVQETKGASHITLAKGSKDIVSLDRDDQAQ